MAVNEQSLDQILTETNPMFAIQNTDSKGDVHLKQPWRHARFDEWKLNAETDGSSVEVIKELDWESTHRQWDENYEVWVMDLSALYEVIEHLSAAGFTVTAEKTVFDAYRDVLD